MLTSKTTTAAKADDYEEFCEAFRLVSGVDLGQYKRRQMERRIRTFAQRQGMELLDYLTVLKGDKDEVASFLDKVTINVSQLWRNPDQWERLERTVIPELAAQTGKLRIWSAGCSYGAEAYTLAALARHAAPNARTEILGTDIDPRIVARARAGVFSQEDARDAKPALLKRFFDQQADGSWAARPELKQLTKFEQGDLLRLRVRPAAYDLVLCRNTVIYFTDEVRDALHARLVESLRPGGYLVVGATERVSDARGLGLTPAFPFTYRKAD